MDLTGSDATYLVAGVALLLALVLPALVHKIAVSSPIVLLGTGVLLGLVPLTDGLAMDPRENRALIEHVTELAVIVALMGVGLALDRPLRLADVGSWRSWSPTWRLLGITMPVCIAAVAALGLAAGLPLAFAVLLGAVLSPTDPVLASEVQVGGPSVEDGEPETNTDEDGAPDHEHERSEVRFSLTSEAGLNDGLAFPFVYAAITIAAGGALWPRVAEWVGFHLLGRVLIGLVVGAVVGALLSRLAFRSQADPVRLAERGNPLLALAMLLTAYGVAELLQGYGFLAVFACALATRQAERHSTYHRGMHELTERLELLLTLVALLVLGIALGRGLLADLPLWGVLTAVALVFVIRPLAGWAALSIAARPVDLPGGLRGSERWAVAFFGIRGIGSIYYLAYAAGELKDPIPLTIWSTVAFTIVLSVVVHGVLATPVMRRIERA